MTSQLIKTIKLDISFICNYYIFHNLDKGKFYET